MALDLAAFTPAAAAAGGALIGLAAAATWLALGRVAGVSGIVGGLLRGLPPNAGRERAWRWAFVAGLALSPWAYGLVAALPAARMDASMGTLVVAGLLVGLGTRYGGGCTSGHGVCGIARLSARSLVATACFMAAGFATVYAVRHFLA